MRLVAAGLSHRSAPVAVRERAVVSNADAPALLRYLVGHAGLSGAAVLSTCNRTEFYITCPDGLVSEVIPRLARYLDPSGSGEVAPHLQAQVDGDALRHLFRVAAGLDSMVVGEAQILGQVKASHRLARDAGTLDPRLDFAFRRATSAGKRVRNQTALGRGAGSLTEVAIDQARAVLGGLRGRGVLLIGAGKISRSAARRLVDEGARLSVASRGGDSALALAERLGAGTVAIDRRDIGDAAADVDVILCSTSSPVPVLTADDLRAVQERRGGRPLPVLDIAVPRDVEPAAAEVEGVHLIDIDALGILVDANLSRRRTELPRAEAMIEQDVHRALGVLAERDGSHETIRALTDRAETLRRREVERGLAAAGAGTLDREQLDVVTRSLLRKLLHAPITRLRESSEDPAVGLTVRDLFDLDDEATPRR